MSDLCKYMGARISQQSASSSPPPPRREAHLSADSLASIPIFKRISGITHPSQSNDLRNKSSFD